MLLPRPVHDQPLICRTLKLCQNLLTNFATRFVSCIWEDLLGCPKTRPDMITNKLPGEGVVYSSSELPGPGWCCPVVGKQIHRCSATPPATGGGLLFLQCFPIWSWWGSGTAVYSSYELPGPGWYCLVVGKQIHRCSATPPATGGGLLFLQCFPIWGIHLNVCPIDETKDFWKSGLFQKSSLDSGDISSCWKLDKSVQIPVHSQAKLGSTTSKHGQAGAHHMQGGQAVGPLCGPSHFVMHDRTQEVDNLDWKPVLCQHLCFRNPLDWICPVNISPEK